MDKHSRVIVGCPTEDDLRNLFRFASKHGWDGEGFGMFNWNHYGSDTAVLMRGYAPNGYAPKSYYRSGVMSRQFEHVPFYDDFTAFLKECAPDEFREIQQAEMPFPIPKSLRENPNGIAMYLEALRVVFTEPVEEPVPPNVVVEQDTVDMSGNIDIYPFVIIKSAKGVKEVSEEEFQQNPTMQKAKNVQHFVRTTISLGEDAQASATCDADKYDERQGILEAMGNFVCQSFCDMPFEAFYRKMKKDEAAYDKAMRKCPMCGTVYKTHEEAIDCLKLHIETQKARAERRHLRKIALMELKQEAYRSRIEAEKQKLSSEDAAHDVEVSEDAAEE